MTWPPDGDHLQIIQYGKNSWHRPMFMEIFMTAAWNIWKERNNMHFRGIVPDVASWLARFKSDFSLLVHRTRTDLHSFISDLVDSL